MQRQQPSKDASQAHKQNEAALTAAAWRPSACAGVCCCARHATTRTRWARAAVLLATKAGCLRRALLAMLGAG